MHNRLWPLLLGLACPNGGSTDESAPIQPPGPPPASPSDQDALPTAPEGPHADHRHGARMPHRFEHAEQWARQFDSPERAAWQKPDAVVASLALPPDARIADIGAGTGYFSVRLARAVPQGHVFAADIEPDMVRYLRQRATDEHVTNITAILGQADDPALPETVDVVFLCNVYHHVSDRKAYFGKVRARMAEGGRLVIVDFEKDAPDDAPGPPREHRVTPEEIAEELEGAGFVLHGTDRDLLPYQYILQFGVS